MNPLAMALAGGGMYGQMATPGINPDEQKQKRAFSAMPEVVGNPIDIQIGFDRAVGDYQQAQQMAQGLPEYNNLGDVLLGAIKAYKGNQQLKDADKRMEQFARKQFDYEQDVAEREAVREQMRAEAERRREEAQRIREQRDELKEFGQKEKIRAQYREPDQGPTVNVNNGPSYTPLQEELAKKDAEFFQDTRAGAVSAGQTLHQINALEQIMAAQETGKIEEAKALFGRYFDTEAGSNYQAFQGISKQMVLSAAEQLSGAMSDGDIRLLEESLPNFGNSPQANRVVTELLRKAAENKVNEFNRAQKYIQENNGTLQGFVPSFMPSPVNTRESAGPRSFDDVMASYGVGS